METIALLASPSVDEYINLQLRYWKTDSACTNQDPGDVDFINHDTAGKTSVCYEGTIHYVLNGHMEDRGEYGGMKSYPLPGGDHKALDGAKFGGVILEDIVESSMEGFYANGGKNAYPRPDLNNIVKQVGNDTQDKGIRTAGFFDLPVCTDVAATKERLGIRPQGDDTYWPCNYLSRWI